MLRKYKLQFSLLATVVLALSLFVYFHNRTISPYTLARRVAAYYHEQNPIVSFTSTTSDSDFQPIYLVEIRGDFTINRLYTDKIYFSTLANGLYIWDLSAYSHRHRVADWPGCPSNLNILAF